MVVKEIDVVTGFFAQFRIRGPFLPVQYFCLHSCPKRLDDDIVMTIPHRYEAQCRAEFVTDAGVCSIDELRPMSGVKDSAGGWLPARTLHEHSQVHQTGLWSPINRPTHCFTENTSNTTQA